MILIDTSAWVEFLRNTGSHVDLRVEEILTGQFAVCDPVRMELLAGARDDAHLTGLRKLMARGVGIPTLPTDYEDAASLYRQCRRQGETVRKLIDCLIASVAIRNDIPILHNDADFNALARHTELQVYATNGF